MRDDVLRRRQHRRRYGLVLRVTGHGGGLMCSLVAPSRVGIIVYPRVSSQLIGPAEAFGAAGERAYVWFLPRVGSYVSRLMFEAVKGLFAEGAFVGSGQVLSLIVRKASDQRW